MDVDVLHRTVRTTAARGRAPVAGAAALGLLGALLAASPAGAGTVPGCVPDGSTVLTVETDVVTAQVGDVVDVRVAALDTCGAVDTGFVGTLGLTTAPEVGEGEEVLVEVPLAAEDEGRKTVAVPLTEPGLRYLYVFDTAEDSGSSDSFTTVYVGRQDRLPHVDGLMVRQTAGSTYRASGFVVDPDVLSEPVTVTVELDSREVVRTEAADALDFSYEFAPDVVGTARGFDVDVPVPAGRHSLCLFTEDTDASGGTRLVNVECRVVESGGQPPTAVIGGYDVLARTPDGYVAAGWAIDGSKPGGTSSVELTASYRLPGSSRTELDEPFSSTADLAREDIGAAFPSWGTRHGFVDGGYLAPSGTALTVCVRAGATSRDLGCRSTTVRLDPVGALDAVTPVRGGAILTGWALDEDTYDPLDVHVYVDGAPTAVLSADGYREDVDAAFPSSAGDLVPGYGPYRGYSESLAMAGGRHEVCAYGINVDSFSPGGRNALLGCRTVVVPSASPLGHVDAAVPAPGGFVLRGWTADPDQPTTALDVHTYRDGVGVGITRADRTRPDLAGLEGGRYGTGHGFTTGTISTGERATVCAYGINVGAGSNTTLRCLDLRRSLVPTGAFDGTTRTGTEGGTTTRVRGWALDPDTTAPVDVHVYVDGRLAGVTTASTDRPDVGAAFAGWGSAHGWSLDVRALPGQQVCTYALNTLQGSGSTTLGCRTA